jgi:uncharacterized Tic20 family protein
MEAPPLTAPAPTASAPSLSDKLVAIGCHLSLLLGLGIGTLIPFIVWLLVRRRNVLVESHARAALNFHFSLIIYAIVAVAVISFTAGFSAFTGTVHGQFPTGLAGATLLLAFAVILALTALTLTAFVCAVIASIRASDGELYHYPLTLPIFR